MSDIDVLVSKAVLQRNDGLIEQFVREAPSNVVDQSVRRAHSYYLLFEDEAALEGVGLAGLSAQEKFYNKYYWFLILSRLYQDVHGPDPSFEDQSMKLLESAPSGVDWKKVQEIQEYSQGAA